MNLLSSILKLINNLLGLKRKRPQVDSSAQKKIDIAQADKKEARLENKEADIDRKSEVEQGARKYGITKRQWKRIDREAKVLGVPFDKHWEESKLRKSLLRKARK